MSDIFLFSNCQEKGIHYTTEDGVTVIHNRLKPYKLKSKGSDFNLKKLYGINLAEQAVLEAGLERIYDFDIDSEGNVF